MIYNIKSAFTYPGKLKIFILFFTSSPLPSKNSWAIERQKEQQKCIQYFVEET
jgi:hypothetical protein